jgi:hypothetical protein
MAKQKSGDGVDKPQAKKGHKRKWSREDHGPDKEFADRSYILNKQRFMVDPYDVPLSGEIEYVVTKKQRTQTPNNGSGDVAAKKKSGRTNNTTQSNITPAKRRGRKPGPKPGMKYKKKEKEEEQKEKSSCDCFSPHESPYGCAMEEKSAHLKSIRAKQVLLPDLAAQKNTANL